MEHVARPGSIVVFVDASPQSLLALDRAARDAQITRAPLHLVVSSAEGRGNRLMDRALNRVQLRDRMILLSADLIGHDEVKRFVAACAKARMLVAQASAQAHPLLAAALASIGCPIVWVGDRAGLDQQTEDAAARPAGQTTGGSGRAAPAASNRKASSKDASRQAS